MIEYGTIISVKEDLAEIEIGPGEARSECGHCTACFAHGAKKRLVWAVNRTGAGRGDRVKILLRPGRVVSALILFLFPLSLFFLFFFLAGGASRGGELTGALAGFAGFGLSYALVAFVSRKSAVKNRVVGKEPPLHTEGPAGARYD